MHTALCPYLGTGTVGTFQASCAGVFRVCIPDSTDRSCDAGLSPGVPFPIIVAWAIGKLYYDNEK